MNKEEKKQKENDLDYLYDNAIKEGGKLEDTENMLLNPDILKTADVSLHDTDYDKDLEDALTESISTVRSLAELYLSGNEDIINNPYIQKKIQKDAQNLADMQFLQTIGRKAIIKQVQSIEDADAASPRHFETLYGGFKEIRENIKQSTLTSSTVEDFYLKLKKDLDIQTKPVEGSEEQKGTIISADNLNSILENAIKKSKE